jgi:adenylylsulfate kinase
MKDVNTMAPASVKSFETSPMRRMFSVRSSGEIPEFTGISAPYEEPLKPELVVDTASQSVDQSVEQILGYLKENGYLSA